MCVGSARLQLSHVCATPTTLFSFLLFFSFHIFSLSLLFFFSLHCTQVYDRPDEGKSGPPMEFLASLIPPLVHRWRPHRVGAPGNIKWGDSFFRRNERRSKQRSRESFWVQMGSSLFPPKSRQRLNENGRESQNGEGIGVERRREAAVGLWNAVSAPLSLSEGFALSHTRPGPIQPRRLTAFLYTLLTNAVVRPQSVPVCCIVIASLQSLSKQNS